LERLILDTTILVAAEREGLRLDGVIGDDDDVAVAAVTAAELLVGVELAGRKGRSNRAAFVENILTLVPIEIYDLEVARAHAVLLAHARRSGRPREGHDLLIAATVVSRRSVTQPDQTTSGPGWASPTIARCDHGRADSTGFQSSTSVRY
jgi:tRNA(fMet)-specific endonuclease VapC